MLFNFNSTSLYIYRTSDENNKEKFARYKLTFIDSKDEFNKPPKVFFFVAYGNPSSFLIALIPRARQKSLQVLFDQMFVFLTEHFTCVHKIF